MIEAMYIINQEKAEAARLINQEKAKLADKERRQERDRAIGKDIGKLVWASLAVAVIFFWLTWPTYL